MKAEYIKRWSKIYLSLRTWAFAKVAILLGLMSAIPEKVQTILGHVISEQWVTDHWSAMTAGVGIVGFLLFGHGSARKKSETPLDKR